MTDSPDSKPWYNIPMEIIAESADECSVPTTLIHATLTQEKWNEQSLAYQMASIGSEVFRAISWRERGYPEKGMSPVLELSNYLT